MLEIIPIDTPSLGDRSDLAHDGEAAIVVDPHATSTASRPDERPAGHPRVDSGRVPARRP